MGKIALWRKSGPVVDCSEIAHRAARIGGLTGAMGRRFHIIYAHPAHTDGYSFFYLYYYPGEDQLALRYGQRAEDPREVWLPPVAMLDLIENQASLKHVDADQLRPWERAAKALRLRLRVWIHEAGLQA